MSHAKKIPSLFYRPLLKRMRPLVLSAKRALIDQPATICKHPCAPPPPSASTQAPEAGADSDGGGSVLPPLFPPLGGWVAEVKRHGSKVRYAVGVARLQPQRVLRWW